MRDAITRATLVGSTPDQQRCSDVGLIIVASVLRIFISEMDAFVASLRGYSRVEIVEVRPLSS